MSARPSTDVSLDARLHGVAPGRRVPVLALEIGEACEALGVSPSFWREHVAGDVRIVRRGRKKMVAVAELERWLDASAERTLERRS
jgi:hypothetical protein